MRKPLALKVFQVYFSVPVACVTIRAASKKEARTIAQDNYNRGELTAENAALRLLPEGRSIQAEFFDAGEIPPYINQIAEEIPK